MEKENVRIKKFSKTLLMISMKANGLKSNTFHGFQLVEILSGINNIYYFFGFIYRIMNLIHMK